MLTMTYLALDSRDNLPRVTYSTALDIYVLMCFFFVFATIVQFAAVHHFTKYGTAEHMERPAGRDTDSDEEVWSCGVSVWMCGVWGVCVWVGGGGAVCGEWGGGVRG